MGSKKTIPLPQYEERQENAYNTSNREMTGNLGSWLLDNYKTVGQVSPEQELKYQDISDKAMEAAWSDYNRELGKAQSVANSRAYNRFGSLTNTPALYDQETFARKANQGAVDLASNTAQYYNNLVNQDINRQLQAWQNYSNMYNKAGEDITNLDQYNWTIRNKNKDRSYYTDVQNFNNYKANIQNYSNAIGEKVKLAKQVALMMAGLPPQLADVGKNNNSNNNTNGSWLSSLGNIFSNRNNNGVSFDSNSIDTSLLFA